MARLNTYADAAELAAVHERAAAEAVSVSFVVRLAIRHLFGMPIPQRWLDTIQTPAAGRADDLAHSR